jgi:hypothetical protein
VSLKVLNDVYVTTDRTVIYDKNFNLVDFDNVYKKWMNLTSYRGKYDTIDRGKYAKVEKEFNDDKNYCCALPWHGCYVYGHILDNIQEMKDYQGVTNPTLLALRETGHIRDLYKNHFNAFGFSDIETLKNNHLYFFKKLIVSESKTYIAQVDREKIDWIRKGYYDAIISKEQILSNKERTKLFLTRHGSRKILNEEEVWEYLKPKGFIKLDGYSYNENFKVHMDLFSRAKTVIGGHGSLFRNSLFTLFDDTIYHEFCPSNRRDTSIKTMSETCGVKEYNQYFVNGNDKHEIEIDMGILKEIT